MAQVEKQVKKTQKAIVAEHLKKHGSISSWEAIELYRCTRLGARIYQLRRDGWQIRTVRDMHGNDVLGGFVSTEALQDWLLEAGFIFWLPLPDGMRLFFEQGAV